MRQLSAAGQQAVNDIAYRRGFSPDAVATMLDAVVNGNGGMAQFSHPEFGGSGQWMRGGMTMIGDMFNSDLKYRVVGLCDDLSALVANQPDLIRSGSFQSQNQGSQQQGGFSGGGQQQGGSDGLFARGPGGAASGDWWPGDLGWPNSTGAQNNQRYAYFAQSRRLAIDSNGSVTVYDTLDHQIGGVSQQQSYGGGLTFSSQYGNVDVSTLPVISKNGVETQQPAQFASPPMQQPQFAPAPMQQPAQFAPMDAGPTQGGSDIFAAIEKLADLKGKGFLSDEEYSAKKAELLSRI